MRKFLLASAASIPDVLQPQRSSTAAEKPARSAARPREGASGQRRTSFGARRDALGDEGASGDDGNDREGEVDPEPGADGKPDTLVPDPQVAREFSVSLMSLWRWDRDPHMGFPTRIVIGRRNYRSRRKVEQFKRRLGQEALARRAREARG
jgi:hypothetical protein